MALLLANELPFEADSLKAMDEYTVAFRSTVGALAQARAEDEGRTYVTREDVLSGLRKFQGKDN